MHATVQGIRPCNPNLSSDRGRPCQVCRVIRAGTSKQATYRARLFAHTSVGDRAIGLYLCDEHLRAYQAHAQDVVRDPRRQLDWPLAMTLEINRDAGP